MHKQSIRKFSRRKGSISLSIIILLLFSFIIISTLLNKGIRFYGDSLYKSFEEEDLNKLWEDKKYSRIISISEEVLTDNFLDLNYLCFNGFANFYLGISQVSLEMKIPLINQSIRSLLKAFILSEGELKGDIAYVLGKAYYYKGHNYSDLTIKYLDIAIDEGYLGKDIYEFRGLAYYELGQYRECINDFDLLPVERHSSEINYIVSESYGKLGNYIKQNEILVNIVETSSQLEVKLDSRTDLATNYFDKGLYSLAIEQLNEVRKWRGDDYYVQYLLGKSLTLIGKKKEADILFRKILRQKPGDKVVLSWLKRKG
ncbi:MAG: hypothetical protein B6229_08775 [Spirochaetaceae bacterium 4572_7]|nr:MAG: hypothetical protein B6229_08775 [Spirochaetaceae bacterium 4572_7]